MDSNRIYKTIYKLFDNVTPINADCGKLCNQSCCKGDSEMGMYLFPHEEKLIGNNFKIIESNIMFKGIPLKIAICNGKCNRKVRPLSCRIFPLIKYKNQISLDIRAKNICPIAFANDLSLLDKEFLGNTKKAYNILNKFKETKEYVKFTEDLINEYKSFVDLFQK